MMMALARAEAARDMRRAERERDPRRSPDDPKPDSTETVPEHLRTPQHGGSFSADCMPSWGAEIDSPAASPTVSRWIDDFLVDSDDSEDELTHSGFFVVDIEP
jgi:hypothetical protein